MRTKTLWSALALLLAPALASGQQAPAAKTPFEVMKANVAQCRNAAEKERWTANVDLWQIALAAPGPVAVADRAKMSSLLETIRVNVSRVSSTPEKERWTANIEMWRVLIASGGVLTRTDASTLAPVFDRMKTNVAAITRGPEKERWMANRDLWQSAMTRAAAAF
jgi:hypothetical protein